jgi:hypothetical protein
MNRIAVIPLILLIALQAQAMDCKIGPLVKMYGGNEWFVYACNDERSIVVVSKKGNPAMPFFFSMSFKDGKYSISGEGNGDKAASAAALAELKKLSNEEISALVSEAKSLNKQRNADSGANAPPPVR